jgi:hypothetical protein
MATLLLEPDFATDGAGVTGGERSLEALVSGAWEALAAGSAACPMCGGSLQPRYGTTIRPVAGRCGDCGSDLS